jgi:hypothetical protein
MRWILIVALLPVMIVGLLGLAVLAWSLVRYDPAFFTEIYREQYGASASTARALEVALQAGDRMLLAELQGLQSTTTFETGPSIDFVRLWEYSDRYITYLYVDMQTYERHPHYVERVRGRWVVAPPDLYYYMRSGRWKGVFLPIAVVWWVLGTVAIAAVWLFRASPRFRAWLYGDWQIE